MIEELRVVHALYFLSEQLGGWRSGLRWRLRGDWVYSPELAALLARGAPPRPPRAAVMKVKAVIGSVCPDPAEEGCGARIVGLARKLAYRLVVGDAENPGETLIKPTPVARVSIH